LFGRRANARDVDFPGIEKALHAAEHVCGAQLQLDDGLE
jgi:hypothetical protein